MMTCRELMNEKVVTCKIGSTAVQCAAAMRDADVGFVPVVDEQGRIAGTVTDRDLCTRVLAEGLSPDTSIGDVMESDVIACSPEDTIEEVEALMEEHKIRRIVVCDDKRRPLGVISLGDIVLNDEDTERVHRVFEAVHHPTPPEQPRV